MFTGARISVFMIGCLLLIRVACAMDLQKENYQSYQQASTSDNQNVAENQSKKCPCLCICPSSKLTNIDRGHTHLDAYNNGCFSCALVCFHGTSSFTPNTERVTAFVPCNPCLAITSCCVMRCNPCDDRWEYNLANGYLETATYTRYNSHTDSQQHLRQEISR